MEPDVFDNSWFHFIDHRLKLNVHSLRQLISTGINHSENKK